jgi:hypothetical protein
MHDSTNFAEEVNLAVREGIQEERVTSKNHNLSKKSAN